MGVQVRVFTVFQILLFTTIIIFAFIYSLPIICVRRFHQHNNILTLNLCLATILCCLTILPSYVLDLIEIPNGFLNIKWRFLNILQAIFTIQVPFSFVAASLHRYCSLVYHTTSFFRTKRWIISCIGSQWILAFILALPNLKCFYTSCNQSLWPSIYVFVSTVVVTSMMCLIINMLIYHYVRSSSRRVHSQASSENVQKPKISHRDIYLLRHMVFMFCIFVGGWTPVYITPIISYYTRIDEVVVSSFAIWCEVALLIDVIDLFLYNHEVRKYLKDLCLRYVRL